MVHVHTVRFRVEAYIHFFCNSGMALKDEIRNAANTLSSKFNCMILANVSSDIRFIFCALHISNVILNHLKICCFREDAKRRYKIQLRERDHARPSSPTSATQVEAISFRVGKGPNRAGRIELWEACAEIQRSATVF